MNMMSIVFPISGSLTTLFFCFPFFLMIFLCLCIGYPGFVALTLIYPIMDTIREKRWAQENNISIRWAKTPLKAYFIASIWCLFLVTIPLGLLFFCSWKITLSFYMLCIPSTMFWIIRKLKKDKKTEDEDKRDFLEQNI